MRLPTGAITIRIPPDVLDGLKSLAANEGESVATIIRMLSREAIARGAVSAFPPRVSQSRNFPAANNS